MKKWKFSEVGPIRFYRGEGDGLLIFHPDRVEAKWHKAAAIAAAHGTGNRSAKVTVATGKRKPPEIDIYFGTAHSIRALWRDEQGTISLESDEARIAKALGDPFLRHHACVLLSAMAAGDFETLQKFTDATRLASEPLETSGIYSEVAKAIEVAAMTANEPPTKKPFLMRGKFANQ
jgi:hypothetical protein